MAVRHGYGKIAGTDALVFAYDTGDTRNSYKGEPTTNLYTGLMNLPASWSIGPNTSYVGTTEGPLPGTVGYKYQVLGLGSFYVNYYKGGLTAGATYTISVYVKMVVGTSTQNNGVLYSVDFNAGIPPSTNITSEWKRIHYTFTLGANSTYANIVLFGYDNAVGNVLAYSSPQLELKSHPTQFTTGTRSSTQGLLDLTGNRTIELANVSFNINAEPEFDGSDDLITFGSAADIREKSYTIEAVFNRYSANRLDGIIGDLQFHWFSFYVTSNNELYFFHRRNSPNTDNGAISATGLVGTGYYHAVGVFNSTAGMRVYLNGNLVASNNNTTAFDLSGRGPQYIGQHRGGAPGSPTVMSGQIPVLKIYLNKALTADEVRNNYRHYKTRFNI
jgi:hypothetical protein